MRRPEPPPPFAPLPFAWGLGLGFGAIAGAAAAGCETGWLALAGVPIDVARCVGVSAVAGAALGWLAGATGAYGPGWAAGMAAGSVVWLASPLALSWPPDASAPLRAGVLIGAALASGVAAQVVSRLPLDPRVQHTLAAFGFVAAATGAPFAHHLGSGALTGGAIGVAILIGLLAVAAAALASPFAGPGRAPVGPLVGAALLGCALHAADHLRPPAPPPRSDAGSAPVILVVVSGLRADRLGAFGYVQPRVRGTITPALDAVARGGIVFDQAHATSNWTPPALASIVTGLDPYLHGAGLNDGRRSHDTPIRADVRTLPERLHAAGIGTWAFVADPALRGYGFDSGFDRYSDDPGRGVLPTVLTPLASAGVALGWPRTAPAEIVADRVIRHLREAPPTGWFTWVQLADLQGPVLATPYDREAVGSTHRAFPSDVYDAALRRVDRAIGRILDAAPANAWVVIVGDRGTSLGERRASAPEAVQTTRYGGTMFEEMLHVPLVVRSPTQGAPAREPIAVSTAYVAPTVLRLAGLPTGDATVLGPVFGEPQVAEVVVAGSSRFGREQQAVLLGRRKLIRYADGATPEYDLGADPAEAAPLTETDADRVISRRLLGALPVVGGQGTGRAPLTLQMGQLTRRLFVGAEAP